jgi:hypothetical protein
VTEMSGDELKALVARIREAAGKATPGNWHIHGGHNDYAIYSAVGEDVTHVMNLDSYAMKPSLPDSEHIATCDPTTMLALCDEVEKVMGERGWQPIATAPKEVGRIYLLFGTIDPHPDTRHLHAGLETPRAMTGYWDDVDHAWCPIGATWLGPWVKPTHWMPLPSAPEEER